MKRFKCILILVLVITCCTQFLSAGYKYLAVPRYAQQTNCWCWAAGGEMIMKFLGRIVPQCIQANNRFGVTNCCCCFTQSKCVRGGWPEYTKYGFTYSSTAWGTALTWSQLKAQINNNKPVGFAWGWWYGGGHYMVARGYIDYTQYGYPSYYRYVLMNDPWPWNCNKYAGGAVKWITYSEYVYRYGHHRTWVNHYNITL